MTSRTCKLCRGRIRFAMARSERTISQANDDNVCANACENRAVHIASWSRIAHTELPNSIELPYKFHSMTVFAIFEFSKPVLLTGLRTEKANRFAFRKRSNSLERFILGIRSVRDWKRASEPAIEPDNEPDSELDSEPAKPRPVHRVP